MKRSKFLTLIITVLMVVALFITSCGPAPTEEVTPTETKEEAEVEPTEVEETEVEPTEAEEAEPVRIGVVLPLTGDGAYYGGLLQTGYQYATKQVNDQGGIGSLDGAPLELIFGDH